MCIRDSLQPLVHRRNVLARNSAALDGIDELVTLARLIRLDLEPDMAKLPASTRLLDELAFLLDSLLDALTISHLRCTDIGINAEFSSHAIDDDFKVEFAHTRDDRLAGFLVGTHAE